VLAGGVGGADFKLGGGFGDHNFLSVS
jgi:hypothetical protein